MAMQEPQAEPSMEEILASIRRIISEEDAPEGAAAPSMGGGGVDVLELTQPAEDPPEDDIVFEEDEPAPLAAAPARPAPAAPPRPRVAPPVALAEGEEAILSPPTASAAAGAFTRLAGSLRLSDSPGQTLEGVVRELLRPMLKDWLDQNLPAIVESKVEAELDRISRLAR